MELTLLLNATYEPLRVLNWQKAITLLWQGKVEVLEVYDREIHGVSVTIKLPSVIRLLKMIKIRDAHRSVKFSRINIFTRDGYRCQYCRRKYRTEDLTFDHVTPIAKGGKKTWENIVTACWACNNKKSGRTPDEKQTGNDGAVSVWSSHYPWDDKPHEDRTDYYQGTVPFDHFMQINWRIPDRRPSDAMEPALQDVYRDIMKSILEVHTGQQ